MMVDEQTPAAVSSLGTKMRSRCEAKRQKTVQRTRCLLDQLLFSENVFFWGGGKQHVKPEQFLPPLAEVLNNRIKTAAA